MGLTTRLLKLAAAAVLLGILVFFESTASFAKPEYSRKTKKECTFCHPPDSYELTDAGKYYRDHGYSLAGYKAPDKSGNQHPASSANPK